MKSFLKKIKYIITHEGKKSVIIRPYKVLISVLNKSLIFLFRCFPVKKNKIILESEGDYTDNVRVFYDYLRSAGRYDFDIIWLVQRPELYKKRYTGTFISRNEYHVNILADYHIATARYFIFSHPYWLKRWRKKQVVINTTHSVAQLKASTDNGQNKLYDYVLTCSPFCTEIRKKTFFDENDDHFLCLGQPRIDLMFHHKDCITKLLPLSPNDKVIVCMETFKQTKSWDDGGSGDRYAVNVITTKEELEELDSFLGNNNYHMIVKTHHLQDMSMIEDVSLTYIHYMKDFDLDKFDIQVNELLENADVLLTDYSSVFYEYLLMDRPIGFLIGDISNYSRGFMMKDPLKEMPGKKIETLKELFQFLLECKDGKDEFADERKMIREKVFQYHDDHNSERLEKWLYDHNELEDIINEVTV